MWGISSLGEWLLHSIKFVNESKKRKRKQDKKKKNSAPITKVERVLGVQMGIRA